MSQVQIIEPRINVSKIYDNNRHRVCAYCRVSTDEDDQKNSLQSQIQFFSGFFERKENWINVGIFADEGLSGTSLEKRKNFNTMISLARQGMIDIILTKEVSRFSRNVQDLLNVVVELRNLGVYVWFLSDDIYTEDNGYRERLTQVAANAEQESLRTSRRVKWGHQQQMKLGTAFGRKKMFGYEIIRDDNGKQNFVIIPDEARIVKQIFEWYVAGDGIHAIVSRLNHLVFSVKHYKNGWNSNTVLRILQNEKYVGDIMQGKSYTPDPLTHKKRCNHGESYRFYIKDHHQPIVDRVVWTKAQEILLDSESADINTAKHSNRFWCSGKIFCGLCGRRFVRLTKKQKNNTYKAWICVENNRHGRYKKISEEVIVGCNATRINDRVLKLAVKEILLHLIQPVRERLRLELHEIMKLEVQSNRIVEMNELENKITQIERTLDELTIQLAHNIITIERYQRVINFQELRLEEYRTRLKQRKNENVRFGGGDIRDIHYSKLVDTILDFSDDELCECLMQRIIKKIQIYPSNIFELNLTFIPDSIIMQYQRIGRDQSFHAIFTILTSEQLKVLTKGMIQNEL